MRDKTNDSKCITFFQADDANPFFALQQRAGPLIPDMSDKKKKDDNNAASNPVCKKLIERKPPQNGSYSCQETILAFFFVLESLDRVI